MARRSKVTVGSTTTAKATTEALAHGGAESDHWATEGWLSGLSSKWWLFQLIGSSTIATSGLIYG